MWNSFYRLFFPRLCAACYTSLSEREPLICTSCRYTLPRFSSTSAVNLQMDKLFWGKIKLNGCYAYYRFEKGSGVQQLIYQLKYKGMKEVGELIGRWMAQELNTLAAPPAFDSIVPVPLHPWKEKKRGYNQSTWFAQGLASVFNCQLEVDLLKRTAKGSSQTNKSRFARWKNTNDLFTLTSNSQPSGKHFLLVDDVVTTGATLESCARSLLSLPKSKVSVAAIALAG